MERGLSGMSFRVAPHADLGGLRLCSQLTRDDGRDFRLSQARPARESRCHRKKRYANIAIGENHYANLAIRGLAADRHVKTTQVLHKGYITGSGQARGRGIPLRFSADRRLLRF